MKKILVCLLILIAACSTKIDERILGTWEVDSKFYKAKFKIEKIGKKLVGKVLYYNDDTTVLKETGTEKDIFLNDLQYKNDVFVDAISGATKIENKGISIKIKHQDTLEVTNYIRNKPLVEIWTRKPVQNKK